MVNMGIVQSVVIACFVHMQLKKPLNINKSSFTSCIFLLFKLNSLLPAEQPALLLTVISIILCCFMQVIMLKVLQLL